MKKQVAPILLGAAVIILGFQNCGKVSYSAIKSGSLVASNAVDSNGQVTSTTPDPNGNGVNVAFGPGETPVATNPGAPTNPTPPYTLPPSPIATNPGSPKTHPGKTPNDVDNGTQQASQGKSHHKGETDDDLDNDKNKISDDDDDSRHSEGEQCNKGDHHGGDVDFHDESTGSDHMKASMSTDGPHEFACVLDGPGESVKLALDNNVLTGKNGTPADICMSENACLRIVSLHFSVKAAAKRGFCPDHSPNVIDLSDAEINEKISALK